MTDSAGYVWLGLLLLAVQVLLAAAVAWLLKQNFSGGQGWNESRAKRFCARMQELTQELAGNVGEHTLEIQALNRGLEESAEHGRVPPERLILQTMKQIVSANRGLEAKLAVIEERIQEQATKIDEQADKIDLQLVEARVDGLTRLANRRAFDDEFTRRFAEYERAGVEFCLLLIDIDHFKQFNDQFGHGAGDLVLQQVARRLSSTMREMDLVARHGGEEFAVIIVAASLVEGFGAAERARVSIGQQAYQYEGHELHVTACVGLAEVFEEDTPATLFKRADAALYAAKQNGRNCGYYNDGRRLHPIHGARPDLNQTPDPPRLEAASLLRSTPPEDAPSTPTAGKPSATQRRSFTDALRRHMAQGRATKRALSILLVGGQHDSESSQWLQRDEHEAALGRMGEVVAQSVRLGDVVTRYGWDQFAVILPDSNLQEAERIEARIRAALAEAEPTAPSEHALVVCVGVAEMWPDDDLVSLARRASTMLEKARAAANEPAAQLACNEASAADAAG